MGKKYLLIFCYVTQLLFSHLNAAAYAQLTSLITQTPTSYKGSVVKMDQADVLVNFEIGPNRDKIIVKEAGMYYIMCTGIGGATSEGAKGYMDIWFIVNNKQVPNSTNRIAIADSSAITLLSTHTLLKLTPGDEISVGYSASAPYLGFIYLQPDNEPAMSSFMLSIFTIGQR